MTIDFGEPTYVEEIPASTSRAGRASIAPAMQAWLAKIEVGKTAELPSSDDDKGHATSRVATIRKAAGPGFKIDTRPIVPGKRYRIFATALAPAPDANAKAPRK